MKLNDKQKKVFKYMVIILFIALITAVFYIVLKDYVLVNNKVNNNTNNSTEENTESNNSTLNNDEIIIVSDATKIRVINYYDATMFEGKKSLLIMFGTWCHNCAPELAGLADIVNYYKDSGINVVLIAHEFEENTLVDYLQSSTIVYNTELYLDLGRVIRKAIDPDAGTVPVSYLLDENCSVVYKHDKTIDLDLAKQLVTKYLK